MTLSSIEAELYQKTGELIPPAVWSLTSTVFAQPAASVSDIDSLTEMVAYASTLVTMKSEIFGNFLYSILYFYVAYVWHIRSTIYFDVTLELLLSIL